MVPRSEWYQERTNSRRSRQARFAGSLRLLRGNSRKNSGYAVRAFGSRSVLPIDGGITAVQCLFKAFLGAGVVRLNVCRPG
jgi:hypothetical protein